jgi:hypothetical protein
VRAQRAPGIVGETPNLAARLQGVSEPNTVVIAESTRKLLGNLFELQDLSAQDLKVISSPVRAWAVLRPASIESRFEALRASGLNCTYWSRGRTRTAAAAVVKGEDRRRPSGAAFRRGRHWHPMPFVLTVTLPYVAREFGRSVSFAEISKYVEQNADKLKATARLQKSGEASPTYTLE